MQLNAPPAVLLTLGLSAVSSAFLVKQNLLSQLVTYNFEDEKNTEKSGNANYALLMHLESFLGLRADAGVAAECGHGSCRRGCGS